MKRAMMYLLVLAMTLSFAGVIAFAVEEVDTVSESPEGQEQMLLDLDYDLYAMESQSYEGKTMEPDENVILLYSSEGYGIVCSFDTGEVILLQFDPETSTIEAGGQGGTYSVEGQAITITDEDGWSVVFRPYEPGLERLFVRMLLEAEAE